MHKKGVFQKPKCHPDRKYQGRGLCDKCYKAVWYLENRERELQKHKDWKQKNRKRVNERSQKLYLQSPEKFKARSDRWKAKNQHKIRAKQARRKARILGCLEHATAEQREWRAVLFGYRCAYCGGNYETIDHVVALLSGGGDHAGNLIPACNRCNGRKRISDWREWYRRQEFYDPKREKFIYDNIW